MRYAAVFFFTGMLCAQAPRIANARMETRNAGNLEATFRTIVAAQDTPAWVGYTVPAVSGHGESCCWSDGYRGCGLEGQRGPAVVASGPVLLEGSSTLVVLYRVTNRSVDKMRTVSGDCELDAGGLPFLLLSGVRPAESVALLESMVKDRNDHAISAIAMHADPAADQALERLSGVSQPESIRGKTLFWLGSTRGRHGYEILKRVATQDPSESVRDKAMFALSNSKEPEAVSTLIESAKNDKSPKVRSQALFWLAHKAGQKETAAITSAIENDPDTQVKKKAVFALSQLPKDEGIPLMIQQARNSKNVEVRKQAMFWLGQSKDPRAIAFFQEVLAR